jgi:cold shock protein
VIVPIRVSTMEGNVKFFNKVKGFGFITTEGGEDVFVHVTQIGDLRLRDGMRVTFNVVETDKGKQAQDVQTLEQHA